MTSTSKKDYIKQKLTNDPRDTGLQVGDLVKWRNDYGAEWEHKVIGFCYDDDMAIKYGRTIYLDKSSFWFPLDLACIKEINRTPIEATVGTTSNPAK